MKSAIQKPKRSKARLIILLVLLVILVGLGAFLAYHHFHKSTDAKNKEAEQKQNQQIKQDTAQRVNNSGGSGTTNKDGSSSNGGTSSGSSSQPIEVVINRVNQLQKGDVVSVRATITGTTAGTCQITFTQGNQTFSKSFPVQVSASSATCGSADIAASDFPADGSWQVQLIVTNNGVSSQPVTSQVDVQR